MYIWITGHHCILSVLFPTIPLDLFENGLYYLEEYTIVKDNRMAHKIILLIPLIFVLIISSCTDPSVRWNNEDYYITIVNSTSVTVSYSIVPNSWGGSSDAGSVSANSSVKADNIGSCSSWQCSFTTAGMASPLQAIVHNKNTVTIYQEQGTFRLKVE